MRQRILDLSLFSESQADASHPAMPRWSSSRISGLFFMAGHSDFLPTKDASLEHAFNFYFASNPIKRVAASFAGKQLYRYYSHIRANLSYPWLIRKEFPKTQIMIGGGAFTAFADQLIEAPGRDHWNPRRGKTQSSRWSTANRLETNAISFGKENRRTKGKSGVPGVAGRIDRRSAHPRTSIFPSTLVHG